MRLVFLIFDWQAKTFSVPCFALRLARLVTSLSILVFGVRNLVSETLYQLRSPVRSHRPMLLPFYYKVPVLHSGRAVATLLHFRLLLPIVIRIRRHHYWPYRPLSSLLFSCFIVCSFLVCFSLHIATNAEKTILEDPSDVFSQVAATTIAWISLDKDCCALKNHCQPRSCLP